MFLKFIERFQRGKMVEAFTLVQVPTNIMLKTRMVREILTVIQCKELCLLTYFLTFRM